MAAVPLPVESWMSTRGKHRAPKQAGPGHVARRVGVATLLTAPAWALGAVSFTSAAVAAPASCSSVGVGARGEVVKAIQRIVGASADGAYGPLTAAAVRTWQSQHGLPATGTVDAATWASFPGGGAGVCTPAAGASAASATSCPTLDQGSRGSAVVLVQRRVGAAADGAFGPLTRAAVARAQGQLNLPATGSVDLQTFTAFGLVGTAACTVPGTPVPTAPVAPVPPASGQQATAAAVAAQITSLLSHPDAAVSPTAATVLAFARAQLGVPYVTGGTTRAGYDCSGLVLASYGAAGLVLNRTAAQQYAEGVNVPLTALAPGDTIYYATDLTNPATIYHTAIYLGGGQMIEAAKPGTLVRQVPLRTADLFPAGARPSALIVLPAANPSSGFTARAIQSRLVAHGFAVSVDGAFGPKTAAAVVSFQRAVGLPATGVVDAATWTALAR